MISFDLLCPAGHRFEGWFGSSDDYNKQMKSGLVACPSCGSAEITKALTAPNIGPKSNQIQRSAPPSPADDAALPGRHSAAVATSDPSDVSGPQAPSEVDTETVSNMPVITPKMEKMIEKMATLQQKALEKSEWVGRKFADEARAIHYGESEERLIHGDASPEEAEELAEEGVSVAPLIFPYIPPEAKN